MICIEVIGRAKVEWGRGEIRGSRESEKWKRTKYCSVSMRLGHLCLWAGSYWSCHSSLPKRLGGRGPSWWLDFQGMTLRLLKQTLLNCKNNIFTIVCPLKQMLKKARSKDYYPVLARTSGKFSWQPWAFSWSHFGGRLGSVRGLGHPKDMSFCC